MFSLQEFQFVFLPGFFMKNMFFVPSITVKYLSTMSIKKDQYDLIPFIVSYQTNTPRNVLS